MSQPQPASATAATAATAATTRRRSATLAARVLAEPSSPAVSKTTSVAAARRKPATRLLDDQTIGLEGRACADDHQSLRLWLRLLSCSTQVETEIRRRLRTEFGMTLARFDYLAQLHRHTDGLGMSALSRYLMVTGGNVTGLTDQLEKEGWVERSAQPGDRRSLRVSLTSWGRSRFEEIASTHEGWVVEIFSGVSAADRRQLQSLLGNLRQGISARVTARAQRA